MVVGLDLDTNRHGIPIPQGGVCRGGDSPLGNGDPVSICIKIQAHHHRIHGGLSQSATNYDLYFPVFFEQFESSADDFDSYRQTKEVKHTHCAVATIRGRSREGIITAFLVPIDDFFMKQPHYMLIEGNQFYPEKSSGIICLNQLSVDGCFFWSSNGQEEQDGKQTRFFWIFVNFCSMSWRKY